jgi:hypothetical protein
VFLNVRSLVTRNSPAHLGALGIRKAQNTGLEKLSITEILSAGNKSCK